VAIKPDNNASGGDAGDDALAYDCVPTGVENTPPTCSDRIDNDCSRLADCDDPSCSGVGSCPVCGTVQHPLGAPLALPDGVGKAICATDAHCPPGQHCFAIPGNTNGNPMECRESYTSSLNFTGFGSTQTLVAVSNVKSVCVTIEHSWMRDLQVDLIAPSGQVLALNRFVKQAGGRVFLGQANDCDNAASPLPGTGEEYCWKPISTYRNWISHVDGGGTMNSVGGCDSSSHPELPPSDYAASGGWSGLIGAKLNGDWTIRVTDLWPKDNGYIFSWSIAFDPTIVKDCSGPSVQ
jgi:hypothetical protein